MDLPGGSQFEVYRLGLEIWQLEPGNLAHSCQHPQFSLRTQSLPTTSERWKGLSISYLNTRTPPIS
jgi:hypothetical protein